MHWSLAAASLSGMVDPEMAAIMRSVVVERIRGEAEKCLFHPRQTSEEGAIIKILMSSVGQSESIITRKINT